MSIVEETQAKVLEALNKAIPDAGWTSSDFKGSVSPMRIVWSVVAPILADLAQQLAEATALYTDSEIEQRAREAAAEIADACGRCATGGALRCADSRVGMVRVIDAAIASVMQEVGRFRKENERLKAEASVQATDWHDRCLRQQKRADEAERRCGERKRRIAGLENTRRQLAEAISKQANEIDELKTSHKPLTKEQMWEIVASYYDKQGWSGSAHSIRYDNAVYGTECEAVSLTIDALHSYLYDQPSEEVAKLKEEIERLKAEAEKAKSDPTDWRSSEMIEQLRRIAATRGSYATIELHHDGSGHLEESTNDDACFWRTGDNALSVVRAYADKLEAEAEEKEKPKSVWVRGNTVAHEHFAGAVEYRQVTPVKYVSWQQDAVSHGAAVYVLDPATGNTTWQWKDEAQKGGE